jgi:hypothetical protein
MKLDGLANEPQHFLSSLAAASECEFSVCSTAKFDVSAATASFGDAVDRD